MKRNKGFTLIELLVVIAIIGILSSVVLASLTSARVKAKVASAQSMISSLRAQAEIGVVNGKYIPRICSSSAQGGLKTLIDALKLPTAQTKDVICAQNSNIGASSTEESTAWGAQATINTKTFCSDSTGFSGEIVVPNPTSAGSIGVLANPADNTKSLDVKCN